MSDERPSNKLTSHSSLSNSKLLGDIRLIIEQARGRVHQAVNKAMVEAYRQIGWLIVEDEQQGKNRAVYGKQQLQQLSVQLTSEFGKSFNIRNLSNMRSFYQTFPIWNAVRTELSWTHYRTLIRLENPQARTWYMQEAIEQNWSARALEHQISVLYYERLLSSQDSCRKRRGGKQHIYKAPQKNTFATHMFWTFSTCLAPDFWRVTSSKL